LTTIGQCGIWLRLAARLFLIAGVLFEAFYAAGACNVPRYRTARTYVNGKEVLIRVSMRLEDLAPRRLICLAEAIKRKYPGRNVSAFIFDSYEAARDYFPSSVEQNPFAIACQSHLHGFYVYNKEKHDDYLLIVPDAFSLEVDSPFTTRIDLPSVGAPVCKLAIDGRCLLEFHPIESPFEDRPGVPGRVTLAASIRRNGLVSNLTVVGAEAEPPEGRAALIDWARGNLSTWRFEPGPHTDRLRITYRFEPRETAGQRPEVRFVLPDEVSIRY
jgi:hypothetical protein